MKLLLLTLDTFSRTGGIQQFNRCLQLALCRFVHQNGGSLMHKSLGDQTGQQDDKYAISGVLTFMGYGGQKGKFIADIMTSVHQFDLILFGHVNLAPLSLLPGLRAKDCRLIAHGVEVWEKLPFLKRRGLQHMRRVMAVSRYTAGVLHKMHHLPEDRVDDFPNCLDPFLAEAPVTPPSEWNKHWRLDTGRPYLLTLARLSASEQAKGYDTVIKLLPGLIKQHPNLGYLLAGKWDEAEYTRIRQLAEAHGVADRVLMPGFVATASLPALYSLAKVFVMPSAKEGFGIVYLEAAWWGCPVVACRAGGVPEALLEGKLGTLVPPGDEKALAEALHRQLLQPPPDEENIAEKRTLVAARFGFESYCRRLFSLLSAR